MYTFVVYTFSFVYLYIHTNLNTHTTHNPHRNTQHTTTQYSPHNTQGLDWFGGHTPRDTLLQRAQEHEATNPEARIVVLSDVWLDKPATLGRLEMILDGMCVCV